MTGSLVLLPVLAGAAELRIAVASNFHPTLAEIADRFQAESGHRLLLSVGSTGKHYAQIRNGAPFDLFFAADRERPRRLEQAGLTVPGTRFTYALGRLVLWSPRPGLVEDGGAVLEGDAYRHLAIANPRLAPYGEAARELLLARGLWSGLRKRLVRGESIGQAFQFVRSGNAELGLVAYSQLLRLDGGPGGSWWLIPDDLHAPIEQQAVMLRDSSVGRGLLRFVQGPVGAALIRSDGYRLPGDTAERAGR
jgi:molybdate transport system substrate-binding protein